MIRLQPAVRSLLAIILGTCVYSAAIYFIRGMPRSVVDLEMEVVLPRFVQVLMAAGDRHLAANLAGFRVLVADTQRMKGENFKVQAAIQKDIAWLNPAHEDNYYIAAAILPWADEVDSAQYVLRRAMDGRPFDWAPVFYFAFNKYQFQREPVAAAQLLLSAAERSASENDKIAIQNIAASWFEKGYEPAAAARVVDGMAEQSRASAFRKYLKQRAERMRGLAKLQDAAAAFHSRHGRPPSDLSELVALGLMPYLPTDPLGVGYGLDAAGRPVLLSQAQPKR